MYKLLGIDKDNIEEAIFYKIPINFSTTLLFTVGVSFILILVTVLSIFRLEYLIIPSIIAIIAVPLFFIYPKFWLYTVTFLTISFFGESADGISVIDVLTGLFFIGGLAVWFFTEVIVNRRKIIESRWEFIYLNFFLLLPLTFIGLYDNDLTFIDWFRGYIMYSVMLYYFPFKKILTKKEDWYIFAHIIIVVAFFTGLKQIYQYYTNIIQDLKYAYQIGTAIRNNQLFFSTILSFVFLTYFKIKSITKQVLLFVVVSIIIIALATSFSRIFWASTSVCILISFLLYYKPFDKLKFFIIVAATAGIFYFALSLFLKDNLTIGLTLLNKRVTSSQKGIKDPSAEGRFVEWAKVIQKIKESPIVGQGINKNFNYNSPIEENSVQRNTIHNGYLHLLYFFGIPLGLTYLGLYLFKLYQTLFLAFQVKDKELKIIIISLLYFFFIFFFVSFMTSEFHKRDDVFLAPIIFALVYFIQNNKEELKYLKN